MCGTLSFISSTTNNNDNSHDDKYSKIVKSRLKPALSRREINPNLIASLCLLLCQGFGACCDQFQLPDKASRVSALLASGTR